MTTLELMQRGPQIDCVKKKENDKVHEHFSLETLRAFRQTATKMQTCTTSSFAAVMVKELRYNTPRLSTVRNSLMMCY